MQIRTWPDIPFWEELAAAHPAATFFHSPDWHSLVTAAHRGYTVGTLGFVFEGGGRAVLPMIQTKKAGLLRGKARLKSSVFGGYGGVLAESTVTADQQAEIYRWLAGRRAAISLIANPFLETAIALPAAFACVQECTQALALTPDQDALARGLNRGAKSNLSQAKKQGVTVRLAATHSDMQAYYGLYLDTLKRWGEAAIYTYKESFFYDIFAQAGPRVKIWLAEKESTIVAGAIVFYWNRIAAYWHGASHQEYFHCYPNNLLHMEIIQDAAAAGFAWYDFGPSGGQEGVVRFKRSFGARELPFVTGQRTYG